MSGLAALAPPIIPRAATAPTRTATSWSRKARISFLALSTHTPLPFDRLLSEHLNEYFRLSDVDLTPVQQADLALEAQEQNRQHVPPTKQCPYCLGNIPEPASKCQHCGSKQPTGTWWEANRKQIVIGLVLVVVLIVAISLLVPLMIHWLNSPAVPSSTETTTPGVTPSPDVTPSPVTTPTTQISLAQYEQVQNGMTYEQMITILGGPSEKSETTGSGYTVMTYDGATPYSFAIFGFEGDKLVSKTQSGLQ